AENKFLLKSWTCADLPEWIFPFDEVITIAVDSSVQFILFYEPNVFTHSQLPITPASRVAVMASGRSDNALNLVGYNYAQFIAGNATTVHALCSPCTLDETFDSHIQLMEYDMDYDLVSQELFHTEGAYEFTTIGKSFEIHYKSNTPNHTELDSRQDTFVVELTFSDAPLPSPAAPVEDDPYCGCKLDDKTGKPDGWNSTEIWLDIVIILDTSESMGEKSLMKASALVESFFGTGPETILNTDPKATYYTRVGVIAMAKDPMVLYELNMTKGETVQDKVHIAKGLAAIDLDDAFWYATEMLGKGNGQFKTDRGYWNTRQVVYYMTASESTKDMSDDYNINQFKKQERNGIVIVNDFVKESGAQRLSLRQLASDGYYFTYTQDNTMTSIQFFCKANCFCNTDYTTSNPIVPYAGPSFGPAAQASGGCFQTQPALSFSKAQSGCTTRKAQSGYTFLDGGLIASVHDQSKAHFLQSLIFNANRTTFYFWLGYSKSGDGQWNWEDKSTNPFTNWDKDE
ncbi:hypothetical protein PENTCL1PPCAC_3856, partial [Pristionchus entomophagus]